MVDHHGTSLVIQYNAGEIIVLFLIMQQELRSYNTTGVLRTTGVLTLTIYIEISFWVVACVENTLEFMEVELLGMS